MGYKDHTLPPKQAKKSNKDLGLWSILLHSPKSWAWIEVQLHPHFSVISFYKGYQSFNKLLWIQPTVIRIYQDTESKQSPRMIFLLIFLSKLASKKTPKKESIKKAVGSFWPWKNSSQRSCDHRGCCFPSAWFPADNLRAPRQCLGPHIQAHSAQGESLMKLSSKILVPESTIVAAETNQAWQAKTFNRQSWQAWEATLTGATLENSTQIKEEIGKFSKWSPS